MLNADDFAPLIQKLRGTLETVSAVMDPQILQEKIKDLTRQASAPDLWDDQENAQKVTSELSAAQSELERLNSMEARIDDLEALVELGVEEGGELGGEILADAETTYKQLQKDLDTLEVRTLLNGEYDERHAVVTIRSGAGGAEAADWAQMLLRMYLRYCERHGYPTKVMDTSYAEEAGIKSATFQVDAPYAYGMLSVEGGTHRLVRISPFDNQGRRQTSFAAVEVIPLIETTDHIDIPDTDIKVDVFRSSGPGGQSVNTTDSAVRLTHIPTGLVVSMQNEKSQLQNKEAAFRVLRSRLLQLEQEKRDAEAAQARASQVRTVDRSERIRTYNFPENRIADHRTGYKAYNLDAVLNGDLGPVIQSAIEADEAARLAAVGQGE